MVPAYRYRVSPFVCFSSTKFRTVFIFSFLSERTRKAVKQERQDAPHKSGESQKNLCHFWQVWSFPTHSWLPADTDSIKFHIAWKNHGTQVTSAVALYFADEKLNVEKLATQT